MNGRLTAVDILRWKAQGTYAGNSSLGFFTASSAFCLRRLPQSAHREWLLLLLASSPTRITLDLAQALLTLSQ